MNDILDLLDELELLLPKNGTTLDINIIYEFLDNQRAIYGGSKGECAC